MPANRKQNKLIAANAVRTRTKNMHKWSLLLSVLQIADQKLVTKISKIQSRQLFLEFEVCGVMAALESFGGRM